MEYVDQLWIEIRRRLHGPLFSTYFFSLVVFNWKIILLLFWYSEEYITKHYVPNDRIQAIVEQTSWEGLYCPFLIAIPLTFLIPILNGITGIGLAKIKNEIRGREEKIARKGWIRSNIYFDRVKELDKTQELLNNNIDQLEIKQESVANQADKLAKQSNQLAESSKVETELRSNLFQTETKIQEYENSIAILKSELLFKEGVLVNLQDEVEKLNSINRLDVLDGQWNFSWKEKSFDGKIEEFNLFVKISDGLWSVYNPSRSVFDLIGRIPLFNLRDNGHLIQFVLSVENPYSPFNARSILFTFTNQSNTLSGTFNQASCQLKKRPKDLWL